MRASEVGSSLDSFVGGPATLVDVLDASAGLADAPYLVFRDERMSFAEHYDTVCTLAAVLYHDYGVRTGSRVALAMRNWPEFVVTFWAAQRLGAIAVPLNAWWSARELREGVEDCDPSVLFVDAERYERLGSPPGLTSPVPTVVVRGTSGETTPAWRELLASESGRLGHPPVMVEADWGSTILYTSGTTGRAKGVIHSHRNHTQFLAAGLPGARDLLVRVPHQLGLLAPMPMFHIGGLSTLYTSMAVGMKLALMYRWDPVQAVELVRRERLTNFQGVVAMAGGFLDVVQARGEELPSLHSVSFGAAVVPPDIVLRVRDQFSGRVNMATGYGMTETTASISVISGQEYWEHPDSVGHPLPINAVKVVDAGGAIVPVGEPGELWVRGPNVVRGYWRDQVATDDSFADGWHRTGDVVRLDTAGRIFLLDRRKDMIIRGGENIYGGEVEAALNSHPDVVDVAVVGVPHETLGEEVGAVVQVVPGARVSVDELVEWSREHLSAFKVPVHIALVHHDLPRNATGKVLKKELRDSFFVTLPRTGTSTNQDHDARTQT